MAQRPLLATVDMLGPFQVLKRPLMLPPREVPEKPAGAPPAGPLAWWKLDETAGTTAANAAGTGLQGQVQGQPHWTPATTPPGSSLEFDGVKNWMEAAESSTLEFREGIAVAAWFKVRQFDRPMQTLLAKGEAWRLQRQGTKGNLEFALTGPAGRGRPAVVVSKRPVDDGQWHHVTASYDGKRIVLYLDGTEEDAVAATGAVVFNNLPVSVGENDAERGRLFHGWIGNVRLYNRGLSAEEAQGLCKGETPDAK